MPAGRRGCGITANAPAGSEIILVLAAVEQWSGQFLDDPVRARAARLIAVYGFLLGLATASSHPATAACLLRQVDQLMPCAGESAATLARALVEGFASSPVTPRPGEGYFL